MLWILVPIVLVAGAALLARAFDLERRPLDTAARDEAPGVHLRLSDGQVHYTLGPGEGPVVVLVPGGTLPMFVFDPLVPELERRGLRVLRYDFYGRGYSDRPARAHDPALYLRQLEELLAGLGIDSPVHVVGLALGGLVGALMANAHPGRVRTLGLIAPDGFGTELPPIARIARLRWVGAVLGHGVARMFGDRALLSRVDRLVSKAHAATLRDRLRRTLRFTGTKRALISLLREGMPIDGGDRLYATAARNGTRLYALWGTEDAVTPSALAARLVEAVPSATVHLVVGAGHLPHYEHPAEAAALIAEEIWRVEGAADQEQLASR